MNTNTKYLSLPANRLQSVIDTIEKQTPGIPFHTLCVLVSESFWGREYKFSPGKVRLRVLGDKLNTQCPLPAKISLNNMIDRLLARPRRPFFLSYGMGVDSTAVIVYLVRMFHSTKSKRPEFRPDAITFADTGNEKKETYDYLPIINAYLRKHGFPEVVVLRYEPGRVKIGWYYTLEQNCLMNRTLPSLAFGFKKCSLKWKRGPQDKYRLGLKVMQDAVGAGHAGIVAIGYDAGPKDSCRSWDITDDELFEYVYPLIELGWDRERCLEEIRAEGLPGWETDFGGSFVKSGGVPVKSACWFCPSTQPEELHAFAETEHGQEYLRGIVRMEAIAAPELDKIEGLWRNGVKGTRGGKAKPGSMTQYIREKGLLTRTPLPLADSFEFSVPEQVAGVLA